MSWSMRKSLKPARTLPPNLWKTQEDAPVVELGIPDDQDGRKEERPRPSLEHGRYQATSQNPEIFENQEILEPAYLQMSQFWDPRYFEVKSS